jgi:hypothetical protein
MDDANISSVAAQLRARGLTEEQANAVAESWGPAAVDDPVISKLLNSPNVPLSFLPDHESGLRGMMAEADGYEYHAFRSLAEAQEHADGVVILEGDDGGQIFVVYPASEVRCSSESLHQLLAELDAIAWPGNSWPPRVFFERHELGSVIPGGMGGGVVLNGGWVHPEFVERQLESQIRAVIDGRRSTIEPTDA